MQDNSTSDIMETLVRYMDGELNAEEQTATEQLLQNDTALQERYQQLLAAKRAIRAKGLQERVKIIQQQYLAEAADETNPVIKTVKQTSFFTSFMRVAAILLVVIGGYGVFQYITTTNQSLYDDAFVTYQIPINRGDEAKNNIDDLYKARNYRAVINAIEVLPQKSQKDYFLLGQSYLQLNNAAAAVDAFKQVRKLNEGTDNKYFVDETDYYLMLADIKAGNIEEAETERDHILSQPHHLFYNKTKDISRLKLTILQWKE